MIVTSHIFYVTGNNHGGQSAEFLPCSTLLHRPGVTFHTSLLTFSHFVFATKLTCIDKLRRSKAIHTMSATSWDSGLRNWPYLQHAFYQTYH